MDFVVYELHSLVFICSIGKSRLRSYISHTYMQIVGTC